VSALGNRRLGPAFGLLLTSLAVTGCVSPREGEVRGTVKMGDRLVPAGTVRFHCAGGKELSAVIRDGAYRLEKVPTGEAKVTVVGPKAPEGLLRPFGPASQAAAPRELPAIPGRYARQDGSGLTCHVTGGQQTFDINLRP
jgi:hypothetical protein